MNPDYLDAFLTAVAAVRTALAADLEALETLYTEDIRGSKHATLILALTHVAGLATMQAAKCQHITEDNSSADSPTRPSWITAKTQTTQVQIEDRSAHLQKGKSLGASGKELGIGQRTLLAILPPGSIQVRMESGRGKQKAYRERKAPPAI